MYIIYTIYAIHYILIYIFAQIFLEEEVLTVFLYICKDNKHPVS